MTQPYEQDEWTDFSEIATDPFPDIEDEVWVFQVRRAVDPEYVLALPEADEGRSNWFWLRTPSNDLMLACYPRGDLGYFGTELDWGR